MARRPRRGSPEEIRRELVELLEDFERSLLRDDLRQQVRKLIPANFLLRDLGSSLPPLNEISSARERILRYMQKYVGQVIQGEELMVVAGISEYARRVRELRVEYGWSVISGVTAAEMRENAQTDDAEEATTIPEMMPDEYMLTSLDQDRDAAFRWNLANEIRKEHMSVRDKILLFFRRNVGKPISGEELRYVAGNRSEWARRTRELRTEYGWPVATKTNGRPDLPMGAYVLEDDRQLPTHDRQISDAVRRAVLQRDGYQCRECGWDHDMWNPSDPRHLEAHHKKHHAKGGENDEGNLITLCNICHDVVHKEEKSGER